MKRKRGEEDLLDHVASMCKAVKDLVRGMRVESVQKEVEDVDARTERAVTEKCSTPDRGMTDTLPLYCKPGV